VFKIRFATYYYGAESASVSDSEAGMTSLASRFAAASAGHGQSPQPCLPLLAVGVIDDLRILYGTYYCTQPCHQWAAKMPRKPITGLPRLEVMEWPITRDLAGGEWDETVILTRSSHGVVQSKVP
jgi:hypothetical protein